MRKILICWMLFLFLSSFIVISHGNSIPTVYSEVRGDNELEEQGVPGEVRGDDELEEQGVSGEVRGDNKIEEQCSVVGGVRGNDYEEARDVKSEEQGAPGAPGEVRGSDLPEAVEMNIAYEYQTDRGIIWDSCYLGNTGVIAYISGNGAIRFIDGPAKLVSVAGPVSNWKDWNVTISENALVTIMNIPGSDRIVWGDSKGIVGIYDWTSNTSITANPHHAKITSLCMFPDRRYVATGSIDSTVAILKTSDLTIMEELTGSDCMIMDVVFSDDGQYLAAGGLGDEITIYQTDNWSIHSRIPIPEGKWMTSMEFITVGFQQILVFSDSTGVLTFHIPGVDGAINFHNLTSWANDLHQLENNSNAFDVDFFADSDDTKDDSGDNPDVDTDFTKGIDFDGNKYSRLVCAGQDGNITILVFDYSVDGLEIKKQFLFSIDTPVYTLTPVGSEICFISGDGGGRLILWSESNISDEAGEFPDSPMLGDQTGNREIPFELILFFTVIAPVLILAMYLNHIAGRSLNKISVPNPERREPLQFPPSPQFPNPPRLYRNTTARSVLQATGEMIPTAEMLSTIARYPHPGDTLSLDQYLQGTESGTLTASIDENGTKDHPSDPRVINIIIRDSVINRSNITIDEKTDLEMPSN